MDVWYPIQVKQKDKVGRPDIDSFEAAMMREQRTKAFSFRSSFLPMRYEKWTLSFAVNTALIVPLTVREILDESIARKLA